MYEYEDYHGDIKHLPSDEFPFYDPVEFLEKQYDSTIEFIGNLDNRKEIIANYKLINRIIKNDNFWYLLSGTKYHFTYDGLKMSSFQYNLNRNLQGACIEALMRIEKFYPYKDFAFTKLNEMFEYLKKDYVGANFG